MARFSLVIDASVAVKWFSTLGEAGVPQAVSILENIGLNDINVLVPDLLFYELANAFLHKKALSQEEVQTALSNMFTLSLKIIPVGFKLLSTSTRLARQSGITVYDACYAAIAVDSGCPLVTANPRHQNKELGCQVIPIEEWKIPD
jgi:predicted nucleic acid-binding protein